jgi:hypothetical protein
MIRLLDVILVSKEEDGGMTTMNVHHVTDGQWSEFGETLRRGDE